jgi:transaldolase
MDDDLFTGKLAEFIHTQAERFKPEPFAARDDAFWQRLRSTGTQLWLDTGDVDAATQRWNTSFSGLTTNNTLLNKEIQKGTYDTVIARSASLLAGRTAQERIVEIAFILNALHGLTLVTRFDARVSVELHTDVAHDVAATVKYAQRFHEICPERFIIKIPLTPQGLIAAGIVREKGIPVNLTLGFSARQNYVTAAVASPTFVNVFLGRINSYIHDNELGDGTNTGEKTTVASQQAQNALRPAGKNAFQIAASMRNGAQVCALAGIDVFTMPPKVASQAYDACAEGPVRPYTQQSYPVSLYTDTDADSVRMEKLWEIAPHEEKLVQSLLHNPPQHTEDLLVRIDEFGCRDIFPDFTDEEAQVLLRDGKIPVHATWRARVAGGSCAIDSLLNRAALAAFAADQQKMDARIRDVITQKS